LKDAEKLLADIDHVHVETMHERKIAMFEQADAFVVLPGTSMRDDILSAQSVEEAFEIMTQEILNPREREPLGLASADHIDDLV